MSRIPAFQRITLRRRQQGQTLVVMALILPVLLAFILTVVEIGGRVLQRSDVEDALQQATRAAVQLFDYRAFADNRQSVRSEVEIIAAAKLAFIQNMQHVGGLAEGETPASVAEKVVWTVLPQGGTCHFGTPDTRDDVSFPTPALCAVLDAPMAGMPLKGAWTPKIRAAATIDQIR